MDKFEFTQLADCSTCPIKRGCKHFQKEFLKISNLWVVIPLKDCPLYNLIIKKD
jgi:hypothetical protein